MVTVGTTLGVFGIELVLVEKTISFSGAAKLTTAFSKVGKFVKIPNMIGGLGTMIGSSAFVGYTAGEAVDRVFTRLRNRSTMPIVVQGQIE